MKGDAAMQECSTVSGNRGHLHYGIKLTQAHTIQFTVIDLRTNLVHQKTYTQSALKAESLLPEHLKQPYRLMSYISHRHAISPEDTIYFIQESNIIVQVNIDAEDQSISVGVKWKVRTESFISLMIEQLVERKLAERLPRQPQEKLFKKYQKDNEEAETQEQETDDVYTPTGDETGQQQTVCRCIIFAVFILFSVLIVVSDYIDQMPKCPSNNDSPSFNQVREVNELQYEESKRLIGQLTQQIDQIRHDLKALSTWKQSVQVKLKSSTKEKQSKEIFEDLSTTERLSPLITQISSLNSLVQHLLSLEKKTKTKLESTDRQIGNLHQHVLQVEQQLQDLPKGGLHHHKRHDQGSRHHPPPPRHHHHHHHHY